MKQVSQIDKELEKMLTWINASLNAAVKNQAKIYVELEKLEKKINEEPEA
jgi:P pilus assembly chaperone PapD